MTTEPFAFRDCPDCEDGQRRQAWPDWLEARLVDEARMGEAYEEAGPALRALLKTCIARLYRIWGEYPRKTVSLLCPQEAFCLERTERPADAALVVCAADYPHPAAFLAALMPAVLAGVREILPCFIPASPASGHASPAGPLLAALELAGVERACVLDGDALLALVERLPSCTSRLLLLGEAPFGERSLLHAHRNGLACRSFFQPPARYDAFVSLDEAHKDLWIWPELDPDWFRLRRVRLFTPKPL